MPPKPRAVELPRTLAERRDEAAKRLEADAVEAGTPGEWRCAFCQRKRHPSASVVLIDAYKLKHELGVVFKGTDTKAVILAVCGTHDRKLNTHMMMRENFYGYE